MVNCIGPRFLRLRWAAAMVALIASASLGAEAPTFEVMVQPQQLFVVDGQPATFTAVTDPAGHEDEVHWRVVTRWGTATPSEGQGATFTTTFQGTLVTGQGGGEPIPVPPPEPGFPYAPGDCQWLAVRAGDQAGREGEGAGEEYRQHSPDDCIPDHQIVAGIDCWKTGGDCETRASFCTDPLPADFFGQGSKAWRGTVEFQGLEEFGHDTYLLRTDEMYFDGWDIQSSSLELYWLELESCLPITVEYEGGSTKMFEVSMVPSVFPLMEQGEIFIHRDSDLGGTFFSEFPVQARYVFTEVGDPENQFAFDTGDPASPLPPEILEIGGESPWSSVYYPEAGEDPPSCSEDFFPGVVNGQGESTPSCCKPIGHSSGKKGHLHKTGLDCSKCGGGGCIDKVLNTCRVATSKVDCEGEPGSETGDEYLGGGTDCRDTDGDGIVDWVEKGNCCEAGSVPQSFCNASSSPFDPDTDNDGVNDGDEISQGRDPCTAGS